MANRYLLQMWLYYVLPAGFRITYIRLEPINIGCISPSLQIQRYFAGNLRGST